MSRTVLSSTSSCKFCMCLVQKSLRYVNKMTFENALMYGCSGQVNVKELTFFF